ncbi:DUF3810 domain-containing protein [Mucilaginibacter koreensis]
MFSILLSLIAVLSRYPAFIEHYYTHGLFVYISSLLRLVLNYIPFSVGDIGYLALVLWVLYSLIACIKLATKRKFKQVGSRLLNGIWVIQLLILMFYICWGLNYSRLPAYQVLNLRDTAYNMTDVKQVATQLIDSLNRSRSDLKAADCHQSNNQIYTTAATAVNALKNRELHLSGWNPKVKKSLFTPLMNYMGTSGYNNPFTGEAQMNTQMPLFDRPVTACHEMAHQLGFAREDEANFLGFLAGIHSADALQRYSAYYLASQEFLFYLHRRDSVQYNLFRQQLSPQVKDDFKADSAYWSKYEGRMERITGIFYNAFLKANKQPEGLRTYNRMIVLTMAYYRRRKTIGS